MRVVTVATCSLNQWAMDFEANTERILQSIYEAKAQGARYRLGPELEICGYSCEDHFLEDDTFSHSWECLAEILRSGATSNILCDIGMPVLYRNVRYNCRVLVLDSKILLVRPKLFLANDGNYREVRFFQPWTHRAKVFDLDLPPVVQAAMGQSVAPIGDAALSFRDGTVSCETCEELFTPDSPHIGLSLDGVEILGNGSGSHHQLRKLNTRVDLIRSATAKNGGVYLYANQQGCDGNRLYFDGTPLIVVNGQLLKQGTQFSLQDVQVISANVDLDAVRAYRGGLHSRGSQASRTLRFPRVHSDFYLCSNEHDPEVHRAPSKPVEPSYHAPAEEICWGPACWLWDYLRRSGMAGFFIPLSGGSDSSSTAAIVGAMCQLVMKECGRHNVQVIEDVKRIIGHVPKDHHELAHQLLHTMYMGTENSSEATRLRAAQLAKEIGCFHEEVTIDNIVSSFVDNASSKLGAEPRFRSRGGSDREDLALQNIQARSRMVLGYLYGQLLPWARGRPSGNLIMLGSSNVDEALRGYLTKYDCSAADINPIGSVSKRDLRMFLRWGATALGYNSLLSIVEATPTAELMPVTEDFVQSDEVDMGMTYDELSHFGRLRKIHYCGPVSMFLLLIHEWTDTPPRIVGEKVKRFFRYYSINRHKMTVLTPSYHAESYSPDDNRFDLRQFLYNTKWEWQFKRIDELVKKLEQQKPIKDESPSVPKPKL